MFTPKANSKRKMVKNGTQDDYGRWALGSCRSASSSAGSLELGAQRPSSSVSPAKSEKLGCLASGFLQNHPRSAYFDSPFTQSV